MMRQGTLSQLKHNASLAAAQSKNGVRPRLVEDALEAGQVAEALAASRRGIHKGLKPVVLH